MAERKSVRQSTTTYYEWEEDIVAAAINAAGLVVSEEERIRPVYTDSDARARGQRVGIMAKAILDELRG